MFDRLLLKLPKMHVVLAMLLVFSLCQAACVMGEAWALAKALSSLWEGASVLAQAELCGIFLACFIVRRTLVFARDSILDRYARARASELRQQLLDTVFSSQSGLARTKGSASIATSAIEGIDQIETYLRLILPKIVGMVAIPVPLLVFVFVHDWVSGIILLVMYPIIIFFMILLGRQAASRAEAQYETYHVLSNHFIDTLRGLPTLKLFGANKAGGEAIYKTSERFRVATVRTLRVATLSSAVLDLIATLGVAAVAIMLGFRLAEGSQVLFIGLLALITAPEYFRPIREFASDYHASLDGKNALHAVIDLIEADARESTIEPVIIPLLDNSSSLSFEHVSFTYGKGDDTGSAGLHDLSFTANGTERIGIVGTSGAGKSTLVNLLGGFLLPDSGSISVAGVRVEGLRQESWQRQVLYIPQDPYIFSASLRDNIAFYTPQADEEAIQSAVDLTGLRSFVDDCADGLETMIGEGGRGLSGGQAQRIALCRALLDDTRRVLLFDEPTAHLDIETELELKERMLPLMEGRLVFFATHRLHWLSDMDRVLVLEGGSIVESGSPDELLARENSRLRALSRAISKGAGA